MCPSNWQCNISCSGNSTTSISGKVYDPAMKNPLYNVEVFVPQGSLQTLPKGVPQGADACNCSALFKSGAVAFTATGVDGSFQLTNVPIPNGGGPIPLVLQIGKWRKVYHVTPTMCADSPQPDKSLSLPGTLAGGDPDDNMPDIAVSTGSADTLECLMRRIGLPDSEYVAGGGNGGHVHVFAGGRAGGGGGPGGPGGFGVGRPEMPGMTGAPVSYQNLWDSQAHLMPYDILLLSCEGGETYNANPPVLEQYLNAGGRVFASHFHYAWFSGPLSSMGMNSYSAPADWGTNLAAWTPGAMGPNQVNGQIVQTLNGSSNPFPVGQKFYQWLGLNGALGVSPGPGGMAAPKNELGILQPRYNAVVSAADKPSQSWINDDMSTNTMYFSFDTPINTMTGPDTPASYCGRAVFSDLHVAGAMPDTQNPPTGCGAEDLTPQEKALEFMLFNLSDCVIPVGEVPDAGVANLQ
jgi:hypothetical protein